MNTGATSEREIVLMRILDASRDRVFECFTEPERLDRWWGPDGFSTSTRDFEFRPGGYWRFIMHGPDSREYPNWIRFREIAAPSRLVGLHGGGREEGNSEITFTLEESGGKTMVTMRSVFMSREARDTAVREYRAIEGGNQTLRRLGEYVASRQAFVITRTFSASRNVLFDAWTDPEQVVRWLGPRGTASRFLSVEVRPGGTSIYSMSNADGTEMCGRMVFRDIVAPERLTYIQAFCDDSGKVLRHPLVPTWPLEMLTTVTFSEEVRQTRITVTWLPVGATEEEIATFNRTRQDTARGWGETFDRLAEHLKEVVGGKPSARRLAGVSRS